jgi:hypothetical protein
VNLRNLVSGAVSGINPPILATVKSSSGHTTSDDGSQVPAYTITQNVPIQVQALTGAEIRHTDNLNMQGVLRAVYLNGSANGIVRKYGEGGDVLIFSDPATPNDAGQAWLATAVLEAWSTWTKIVVTLQLD